MYQLRTRTVAAGLAALGFLVTVQAPAGALTVEESWNRHGQLFTASAAAPAGALTVGESWNRHGQL